ncbi:MAG TPA: sugar phosphate isomerase/epimerase family protein [Bacteroidales bacterium]|nr:sugar phosphate isomerase/epimerase family protein [Bacteroidales bacterium]
MRSFSRRTFIRSAAIAAGTISLSGLNSCSGNQKRIFRYSLCSESVKEFSWAEQCAIIGKAGFDGVEIAPFTLVKEGVQEITAAERKNMVRQMKDAGLSCPGLHWLFVAPPAGLHFTTPDPELRQRSVDYLDRLIDFCGDMEGEVMVFGSPAQRGTTAGNSVGDAVNYFTEGLRKVADHAKDRKVSILIESLPKSQTDVVNTLGEAVDMAKKIGHPAVATMFDYHNSTDETEPLAGLVQKYIDQIRHVHVQNMDGTMIKAESIPDELLNIIRTLKDLDYKGWISAEIFDFSPGGKTIAEETMRMFRELERSVG